MGIFDILKKETKVARSFKGWKPDPTDKHYNTFDKSVLKLTNSESKNVDLRVFSSPIQDQLSSSSCVSHGVVKALEIKRIIKHGQASHIDLSRLFVYYYSRDRENPPTANKDNGTYINLAVNLLTDLGICSEKIHPFSLKAINKCPSQMAAREARLNRIKSSFKIKSKKDDRLEDILFNLRAGNPVIFGTAVGQDWMDYNGDGVLGVETRPLGGHCTCLTGYIDGNFLIENSWGKNWGLNGYCLVKPEVLTNKNSDDFWVIVDGSEAWTEKK